MTAQIHRGPHPSPGMTDARFDTPHEAANSAQIFVPDPLLQVIQQEEGFTWLVVSSEQAAQRKNRHGIPGIDQARIPKQDRRSPPLILSCEPPGQPPAPLDQDTDALLWLLLGELRTREQPTGFEIFWQNAYRLLLQGSGALFLTRLIVCTNRDAKGFPRFNDTTRTRKKRGDPRVNFCVMRLRCQNLPVECERATPSPGPVEGLRAGEHALSVIGNTATEQGQETPHKRRCPRSPQKIWDNYSDELTLSSVIPITLPAL